MFATKGTEFSQFQSTRCIVSILLSNISGNARWFLINTISNTTGTFQNHRYSDIFTLGHEPPLDFSFTQLFLFQSETKKKKGRKKQNRICNLLSSYLTGKDLPPWKGWFIRIDMRVQLHCIARIHVVYLKEVDLLASRIVQSSSRRAPFPLGPQRQNVGLVPTVHHGRKDSLSRDR